MTLFELTALLTVNSSGLEKGIAQAGAAIVSFGKESIAVGRQFDTSMAQVAATMGKPVEAIGELRDYAMEMGAKTAFSATEASEALNYMALAGYDAETAMSTLPNVLNLAAAGTMALGDASDMVTDAQSALGLSIGETTQLVDRMAMTAASANASVDQMGRAILQVGGTAKTLQGGMYTLADGTQKSYDGVVELNQVLGILADNGIKGAEGGTKLRNMILSLTAPSTKGAKAIQNLGLEIYGADGQMRSMRDIFTDLNSKLDGMSESAKAAVKTSIFNKTDLKAVNALLGTQGEKWDDLADKIDNSRYAAEKMAKTQLDNLNGDITLMQSALEGVRIVLSDLLTPDLRAFVQTATKGLTAVTDAFNNTNAAHGLVESLQEIDGFSAEAFSSMEVAFQSVADASEEAQARVAESFNFENWNEFSGYVDAIEGLKEQFSTLQGVFSAGISLEHFNTELYDSGALVDEIIEKSKAWTDAERETFAQGTLGLENWEEFIGIIGADNEDLRWKLDDVIKAAYEAANNELSVWKAINPDGDLEEFFRDLTSGDEGLQHIFDTVRNADTLQIQDSFSAVIDTLLDTIGVTQTVKDAFSGVKDAIDRVQTAVESLTTKFAEWTDSGTAAEGALTLLGIAASGVSEFIAGVVEKGASFLEWLMSGSDGAQALTEFIGGLVGGFIALKTALAIGNLIDTVRTAILGLNAAIASNPIGLLIFILGTLVSAFITAYTTSEDFRNTVNGALEKVKEIGGNIIQWFGEKIEWLAEKFKAAKQWGADFINNLTSGFSKKKIADAAEGAAQEIADRWEHSTPKKGPLKDDDKWTPHMMDNLISGIKAGTPALGEAAENAAESVENSLTPVRDWAHEIGEYIVRDLANGIEKEKTKAQQAAEKALSNIYNGLSKWADRATKYEALSLQEQLSMWEAILDRFDEGTDQWWSAYDKVWDLRAQVQSDLYSTLTTAANKAIKQQKLSAEEQIDVWKHVQSQFEAYSEEWTAIEDKYFDLEEKAVQEHYSTLADSVERATKRQKLSLWEQLTAWEDIMGEFYVDSEQWTAAEEKVYDLRESLLKEYVSSVQDANKTIASLQADYDKELESRAASIAGTYKLFDAVKEGEGTTGAELTKNLRRQVQQIREFYNEIDRLEERGVASALVDEIRAMGPTALGELNALLQMSDTALTRYSDLYEEKQALANEAAVKELSALREETDNKIREQLATVESLYEENAPVIGETFTEGLAKGILSGMDKAIDAAIEAAKTIEDTISARLQMGERFTLSSDITSAVASSPTTSGLNSLNSYIASGGYEQQTAQVSVNVEPAPVVIDGQEVTRIIFRPLMAEIDRHGRQL